MTPRPHDQDARDDGAPPPPPSSGPRPTKQEQEQETMTRAASMLEMNDLRGAACRLGEAYAAAVAACDRPNGDGGDVGPSADASDRPAADGLRRAASLPSRPAGRRHTFGPSAVAPCVRTISEAAIWNEAGLRETRETGLDASVNGRRPRRTFGQSSSHVDVRGRRTPEVGLDASVTDR